MLAPPVSFRMAGTQGRGDEDLRVPDCIGEAVAEDELRCVIFGIARFGQADLAGLF